MQSMTYVFIFLDLKKLFKMTLPVFAGTFPNKELFLNKRLRRYDTIKTCP